MIILGDQSPWLGGLLRWKVLKDAGEDVSYHIADMDSPVVDTGNKGLGISEGWPDYFALGWRYPCTVDAPGIDKSASADFRQMFGMPSGLRYLIGGHVAECNMTLHSAGAREGITKRLEIIMAEEINWLVRLQEVLGMTPSFQIQSLGSPTLLAQFLAEK